MSNNTKDQPKSHTTGLAARVKAALQKNSWSVPDLRREIVRRGHSITDNAIYNLINGTTSQARPDTLWLISEATGVKMADLDPRYAHAKNTIWQTLLAAQTATNMDTWQMAEKLGIGRATYSEIVKGSAIRPTLLAQIRRTLGLPVEDKVVPDVGQLPAPPPPELRWALEQTFDDALAAAESALDLQSPALDAFEASLTPDQEEVPNLDFLRDVDMVFAENGELYERLAPVDDAPVNEAPTTTRIRFPTPGESQKFYKPEPGDKPEPRREEAPTPGAALRERIATLNWLLVQALRTTADLEVNNADPDDMGLAFRMTTVLYELFSTTATRSPRMGKILDGLDILIDPQSDVREHSYEIMRLLIMGVPNMDDLSSIEASMYEAFLMAVGQREELR